MLNRKTGTCLAGIGMKYVSYSHDIQNLNSIFLILSRKSYISFLIMSLLWFGSLWKMQVQINKSFSTWKFFQLEDGKCFNLFLLN